MAVLDVILKLVHIFVCLMLMFVVLLQQGRGGGLGTAFGGGAASQVFGGRGAGNILTRATAIAAAVFMLTSITLAYRSSSMDRALQTRLEIEKQKKADKGHVRAKDKPASTASGALDTPPPTDTAAGAGTITLGAPPVESAAPAPASSSTAAP